MVSLPDRLGTALRRLAAVTERWRVRTHLWRAERRLRLRSDGPERRALLDRLRAYRRRGEYPTNRHTTGRTPVFRDGDGVRCAMGELAAVTGREDVVDRVAAADNTVDLSTDDPPPALSAWLDDLPLSRAEAALVQPTYGGQIVQRSCEMLTCAQVKLLVVSWAVVSVALVEGAAYLALDRLGLGESLATRAGALATVGLVALVGVGALAAVVVANVDPNVPVVRSVSELGALVVPTAG